MGKGYRHGSEELSYGLQIVGGTTRPKNPTQGMVWANTPNEITSVYLAGEKPKNPVAGGLWVKIGDSGSKKIVSPVSKEWITVYPLSAEQYVNDAWTTVRAMSYQYGEWVTWLYIVLKDGEWGVDRFVFIDEDNSRIVEQLRSDGTGRNFYRKGIQHAALIMRTEEKIPATVNALTISANMLNGYFGSYNTFFLSKYDTWPESYNNQIASLSPFSGVSVTSITNVMNLSSVTEDAYLWVACAMGNGNDVSITIKDILEVV